ncbi:MAG: M48 family metallopeptidase [Gemmataceae bacterium]
MRIAIIVAVVLFVSLFALTTIPYTTSTRQDALTEGFTTKEIETGVRRSVQRDLIFWSATAVNLGLFGYLVLSGVARRWTDRIQRWMTERLARSVPMEQCETSQMTWWLTLVSVWACCFAVERLLLFPFAILSLENSRVWGMTDLSFLDWLGYYGQRVAFSALLELAVVVGLFFLIRQLPRWWWIWAGALGSVLGILVVCVWPVWVVPMFYEVRPLEDAELNARIVRLADKAEVTIDRVYVMNASSRSRHTNAYFMGLGATRRILLYDTLLKSHSYDEVESVLAHEIGHWKHNHSLVGVALWTCSGFLGFFLLRWALIWAIGRRPFRLRSQSDPASIPYILLVFLLANWAVLPVECAIQRHFERQADWVALELTENAQVFVGTEKKMARDNIANVVPNPFTVWMFSTHPTVLQRIGMARRWRAGLTPSPVGR